MSNDKLVFVPDREGSSYGHLCVAVRYVSYDKPEVETIYYPASARQNRRDVEHLEGLEVHGTGNDGMYRITSSTFYLDGKYVRLVEGGKTTPLKREVEHVPPPKVRKGTETRWHNGYWQKYSKREGWVAA